LRAAVTPVRVTICEPSSAEKPWRSLPLAEDDMMVVRSVLRCSASPSTALPVKAVSRTVSPSPWEAKAP
jgi:hypothetical protein